MKKKFIRTIICVALALLLLRWVLSKLRTELAKASLKKRSYSESVITVLPSHLTFDIPEVNTPYTPPTLFFNASVNDRQKAVVAEFLHAWSSYRENAWGRDELKPLSKGWIDYMGVGLTIIDSLDTMYIMGLKNEFKEARDWVAYNLSFTRDAHVSVFEITIRALGGLLSAYHLSQDRVFLDKAMVLGSTLSPCFDVNHFSVPCNHLNLKLRQPDFSDTSTAEAGTLQLELGDLGRSSGISHYRRSADAIAQHLHSLPKLDGLAPNFISASTGRFRNSAPVSIGANGDSYYEYLLKTWIQTGKTKDWLKADYLAAIEGIRKHLLRYTHPNNFAFVGFYDSIESKFFIANMEHLACFLPGTLVLGVLHGLDRSHLTMAANLTATCYEMYRQTATGLSPDVVAMNTDVKENKDIYSDMSKAQYLLRPETVESLYYMYYATKNEIYRTWAWAIFDALKRHARVDGGYAVVENVNVVNKDLNDDTANPRHSDRMETFFLAETLKYLYLIFADEPQNLIPLQHYVFNTEAHPLPIYSN